MREILGFIRFRENLGSRVPVFSHIYDPVFLGLLHHDGCGAFERLHGKTLSHLVCTANRFCLKRFHTNRDCVRRRVPKPVPKTMGDEICVKLPLTVLSGGVGKLTVCGPHLLTFS